MWTRKDIKEFKDSIRKDPDSVIKVGSGETVTVSMKCSFLKKNKKRKVSFISYLRHVDYSE